MRKSITLDSSNNSGTVVQNIIKGIKEGKAMNPIEESLVIDQPKSNFYNQMGQQLVESHWRMENFEIGKSLGKGKFSSVYIARDKKTNFIVALKVIQKKILKETNAESALAQEIKIQSYCDHPNILKLYGYIDEGEKIILILEYAVHGQLFNELKEQPNRQFSEEKASSYIRQVLNGIQYLHHNEIIHRDLKPENIMISNVIKLLSS